VKEEEIYRLNDEATDEDCVRMSCELQQTAMRQLAKAMIRLTKESSNDD
jgi:hypothetical protein